MKKMKKKYELQCNTMSARVVGVGGEKTRVENVADTEAIETDESDTDSTKANAEFTGTDTESIASTKTGAEHVEAGAEHVKADVEPKKDPQFRRRGSTLGYTDPPRWPLPHQPIRRSLFGSEVPSPQSLFY